MSKPLLMVLVIGLCHASVLHAESVGSPSSILKKGEWLMGVEGGTLSDRGLETAVDANIVQVGHYRGYGLTDWLSVYGKIGWAHLEIDDASIIKRNDKSTTHRFGGNVLVSGQLKTRFWQHAATGLEWDGSVKFVHIRAERKGKNEGRWNEWQFATSAAKPFGKVTPYAGVKASLIRFKFRARQDGDLIKQDTYNEDGVAGVFVGSDVYFGRREDVVLNIESSYVDGAEVTVALGYTF